MITHASDEKSPDDRKWIANKVAGGTTMLLLPGNQIFIEKYEYILANILKSHATESFFHSYLAIPQYCIK